MKYAIVSFHAECVDNGILVAPGTEITYDESTMSDYVKMLVSEGILVPVSETATPEAVEETSE